MREAMIMYNSRNLTSYKELFKELYHPFDNLYILFEVFFNIMVLMAVAVAISGAASALKDYIGLNYTLGIVIVGLIVLCLTIFGTDIVRLTSTYMGIAILISAISIYTIGIIKGTNIFDVITTNFFETGFSNLPKAILNSFTYAGFQCVTLPTMVACGTLLKNKKGCSKSMNISFLMNSVALVLSILMLLSWQGFYTSVEGGTVLPTLTVCKEMGMSWMTVVYAICLILCLLSTGVTTTFGFVSRFEKITIFKNIKSSTLRCTIVSAFIIMLSMTISLVGLTNIIKYGYGYCGYIGIAVIIIPFLTIGVYKNRKYLKENPKYNG